MNATRRGLFGLFAGALATPVLAKLPALAPVAYTTAKVSYGLSLSQIVTETLRSRGATIADNLMKRNALLDRLSRPPGVANALVIRFPAPR